MTENKICKKCGTPNSPDARYCQNCGTALKTVTNKKPEINQSKKSGRRLNPYSLLTAAFIFAIIVIILILNSNREALAIKMQGGRQNKTSAQGQNAAMPSMEIMQDIQNLKSKLATNPDDFEINVQMANNYFDIGQFDKAIGHYRRAILVKGDQTNVLIDLGVCYFNMNQADSALHFIDNALEIRPDHPQGLYNKGVIYFNMKKNNEAKSVWEKLVEKYPETPEAQAARDFLTHLNEH